MAGYSVKPLAAKPGIQTGTAVLAIGAPPGYRELLAPVPDGVVFAVDATWSALKLIVRRERRRAARTPA